MNIKNHLFCIVTGMEHSGTTWLAELLKASLEKVDGGSECGLLLAKYPAELKTIQPFYTWLCTPRNLGYWGLTEEQRDRLCDSEDFVSCYRNLIDLSSFLEQPVSIIKKSIKELKIQLKL